MKMNVLKTARMISKGRSIIGYSQYLPDFDQNSEIAFFTNSKRNI